jgi:lysophospholipase L1-like esterase
VTADDDDEAPRPRLVSRLRRVGALIAANLLAFLVLESLSRLVLAVAFRPEVPTGADLRDWVVQAKLSFGDGLYVWDPACLWRLRPGYEGADEGAHFWGGEPLRVNSSGHRGPERPVEKAAGVKRALVLGGSHPMGMYVRASESWTGVLESRLRANGTWEVLNASVPGHTSFQGRRYLETLGAQFEPDLVIADLGVNDTLSLTTEYPRPDAEAATASPPPWAMETDGLLASSGLYRLIRRLVRGAPDLRAGTPTEGTRVPPDERERNLDAIARFAESIGARAVFLSQVTVDLAETGRAACVFRDDTRRPRVDVCALFEAQGADARRWFVDPVHANAAGHALIGNLVADVLVRDGLVTSQGAGAGLRHGASSLTGSRP